MKKSINLLPIERKNVIKVASLGRFFLKIGIVFLFSIFLFSIFLFANLFIISIYSDINEDEINRTKSSDLNGLIQETKTEIDNHYTKTNQAIKEIKQRNLYWEYLNQINEILPEKIYYSKIVIEADTINLEGLAQDRDDLVSLKEALNNNDFFKEVKMPISSLTSQENVNFELNLVLNKK